MTAVSVVIVNFNGAAHLDDCLPSLAAQTYRDFEVLFVDNGSSDGSISRAEALLPGVRCISLATNTGFAAGNNVGIRAARGRYLVLLNNDTQADPRFLEELVRSADNGPRVGMVGPKILNFFDRGTIDSVGGLVLTPDGIGQGRGRGQRDCGQYDSLENILLPSGCAALYRREMLDEVGLLDERFFAYCEDTDLGLRCRWAGWEAVSSPRAVVYHKYSASSGKHSPLKMYLVERNHYWVALRNFPWTVLTAVPFWTAARFAIMAYAVASRRGKGAAGQTGALAIAFLRGHRDALWGSRAAIFQKRPVRRLSPAVFARLLRANRLPVSALVLND